LNQLKFAHAAVDAPNVATAGRPPTATPAFKRWFKARGFVARTTRLVARVTAGRSVALLRVIGFGRAVFLPGVVVLAVVAGCVRSSRGAASRAGAAVGRE
jgi:hypothetical protein